MESSVQDFSPNPTPLPDQEELVAGEALTSSKTKVCEHCGRTFEKTPAYLQHVISHRPVQQCKWCAFKSKDEKRFAQHLKGHLEVQCNICLGNFATPRTKRIHKKRIHKLYECKICSEDFSSEEEHAEHISKEHNSCDRIVKTEPVDNFSTENDKCESNAPDTLNHLERNVKSEMFPFVDVKHRIKSENDTEPNINDAEKKSLFICYLCNKETRDKCELKVHIAQHLGVSSSKIKDEDLFMDNQEPYSWNGGSSSHSGKGNGVEVLGSDNPMHSMLQELQICSKSKFSYSNLTSPFSLSIVSQLVTPVQDKDSVPTSAVCEGLAIKEEPAETDSSKNEAIDDDTKMNGSRNPTRYRYVRKIPCDQCGATFKTIVKLRQHEKQKHKERPTCPLCNTSKTNVKKVLQHQISAHKTKLRCHYLCLALFDTKEEQSAHHLQVHKKDDSKVTCRYCKVSYPKGSFIEHVTVCEKEHSIKESVAKSHECSFCDLSFQTLEEYGSHIKYCGPWNKKADVKKSSGTPMVLRERNPLIDNAELADIYFEENSVDREQLEKEICQGDDTVPSHEAEEPEVAKHKCKHCSLTFRYKEDGINHVLAHHKTSLTAMTKEPQMCHVCGKTFVSSLSFCKHILHHYSDLGMWDSLIPPDIDMETVRNVCWICKTTGMSTHRYHAVRRDEAIENILASSSVAPDGEPFNCSVCDEPFPDRLAFWKHMKLHLSKSHFRSVEGGKRLKCCKCPLKFKKKSELQQHLGTHLIHSDAEVENVDSENSEDDSDSTNSGSRKKRRLGYSSGDVENRLSDEAHVERKLQKCKRCRKKFSSRKEALSHVQIAHKSVLENMVSETQICHICDKEFRKPMLLCRHLLHHYSELNMWDDLIPRNILNISLDRRFCWICNNMLGRKASRHLNMRNSKIEQILTGNSKQLAEEPSFRCTVCDATCSDRFMFWKHINLHFYKYPKKKPPHPSSSSFGEHNLHAESLDCSECFQKFNDKTELNKHAAAHFLLPVDQEVEPKESIVKLNDNSEEEEEEEDETEDPPKKDDITEIPSTSRTKSQGAVRCVRCSKIFPKTTEAVQHVVSAHKFFLMRKLETSEMCHLCGTIFKSHWCLCKHVCKHYSTLEMWDALVPRDLLQKFDFRNYCWICKCKLGRKYVHHIGKRNFIIEKILQTECTEEYERDFYCEVCDLSFSTRLRFWNHIKIHICKPPFNSKSLDSTTASSSKSRDRMPKYLDCSECPEKFLEEHELYNHMANHYVKPVSQEGGGGEETKDEIDGCPDEDDEFEDEEKKELKGDKNREKSDKMESDSYESDEGEWVPSNDDNEEEDDDDDNTEKAEEAGESE